MSLNLHLLNIFYNVITQQSFSRAAELLFISQSATSKAVKTLEHQLGLTLIERGNTGNNKTPKSIALTEDGQALYEHARRIFALERVAREEMQARQKLQRGKIAIGVSTTIAGYWLPEYLADFHQHSPTIDLIIQVGNTQTMAQALIDCEIDIALVEGEVNDEHIQTTIWQQEELTIIVPKNHTLTKIKHISSQQLSQQTWLCRESGSGTFSVVEQMMQKLDIQPTNMIEIGSNESIAHSVVAGLGISILPIRAVADLIALDKADILSLPTFPSLTRNLYLLQLKSRPTSPLVQLFINTLWQESF